MSSGYSRRTIGTQRTYKKYLVLRYTLQRRHRKMRVIDVMIDHECESVAGFARNEGAWFRAR